MGRFDPDRKAVLFGIPFALAVIAFIPVLFYDLVWDDAIIYSVQLPYFRSFYDAFGPPPALASMTQAYYRPLVFVSYMFDRFIAGIFGADLGVSNAPQWIPHATTLLGHASASGLVALFARRLFDRRADAALPALTAGALFALHPVHADSVAFASGRSDIYATVFFLCALLAATTLDGVKSWLLAAVFFLTAILFKETAVVLMIVCPLAILAVRGKKARDAAPAAAALSAALGLYLVIRHSAVAWSSQITFLENPAARLFNALGYYVYRAVFPWPQYLFVMDLPFGPALSAGIITASLAAAVFLWKYSEDKWLTAGLLLFFPIALSPSLMPAVAAFSAAPAADRYLYLPSAAVAILAALMLGRARRAVWMAAAIGVGAFCLASNYYFAPLRSNDFNFWGGVAEQQVSSMYAMPWVSLGQINLKVGRYEEARVAFKKAAGQEMRSNLIQSRLATHGYAEANTELSKKLASTSPGTAMELAKTAVNILRGFPLRKIDDVKAAKDYAEALMALLTAEESSGLSDPGLHAVASNAVTQALAVSPGDAVLLSHMRKLSRVGQ